MSEDSGHIYQPTYHFRWKQIMVKMPSNWEGGPGAERSQLQLQQAWANTVNNTVEWRPVPVVD